jgi:hypothetical protein
MLLVEAVAQIPQETGASINRGITHAGCAAEWRFVDDVAKWSDSRDRRPTVGHPPMLLIRCCDAGGVRWAEWRVIRGFPGWLDRVRTTLDAPTRE